MGLLPQLPASSSSADTPYWLRMIGVLVIVALLPLAFPAVMITPRLLLEAYEKILPDTAATLQDWRIARSGEGRLPQKVKTMLAMLRENRVMEFRYSVTVVPPTDDTVTQRLAESAFPIRINVEAHHLLASATETLAQGCLVIASKEGIVLARCP